MWPPICTMAAGYIPYDAVLYSHEIPALDRSNSSRSLCARLQCCAEVCIHEARQGVLRQPGVIDFARPGLVITINSAKIASDGTITVTYTLTDPAGLPLDAAGVTTPGAVSLAYVASYIPTGQAQYVAYTTRANSGPAVASTNQPGGDTGGVVTATGPGQYQYVFHTKAPTGFDTTATHTIGI